MFIVVRRRSSVIRSLTFVDNKSSLSTVIFATICRLSSDDRRLSSHIPHPTSLIFYQLPTLNQFYPPDMPTEQRVNKYSFQTLPFALLLHPSLCISVYTVP